MKIQRRKNKTVEVYTSSLNDIMFFLMLFFLIISTMVTPAAIRVLLPSATSSEKLATKKNLILTITADKKYFIADREVEFEYLSDALSGESQFAQEHNEDLNVLLQADKNLSLQDVVDVIDIGNQLKIKMVLFTQKPN